MQCCELERKHLYWQLLSLLEQQRPSDPDYFDVELQRRHGHQQRHAERFHRHVVAVPRLVFSEQGGYMAHKSCGIQQYHKAGFRSEQVRAEIGIRELIGIRI
jgi:hypothetical protein